MPVVVDEDRHVEVKMCGSGWPSAGPWPAKWGAKGPWASGFGGGDGGAQRGLSGVERDIQERDRAEVMGQRAVLGLNYGVDI